MILSKQMSVGNKSTTNDFIAIQISLFVVVTVFVDRHTNQQFVSLA